MSDFQSRFDSLLAEANSAVSNNTMALREALPGMHPNHVRRLLAHTSKMLGLIDKGDAQHPEYLAGSPLILPERAIQATSRIKGSFENGVEHFLQDVLPQIVDIDDRLTRAVGLKAYSVSEVKNAQVKALNQYVDWAKMKYGETVSSARSAKEQAEEATNSLGELQGSLTTSKEDAGKIAEIRTQADKLAKGNANQNPLEKLVRTAREKIEEINGTAERASANEQSSKLAAETAKSLAELSKSLAESLEDSDRRADEILRNATQAGLAGAYKTERDHLAREQRLFAYVFYGIVVSIITYAAFFILPIFQQILKLEDKGASTADSALMLLVRLIILSPVIWALIFTNRRFRYLETLQMDYAAKTATALAYSGYIEEMDDDDALTRRLKDGLVMRFLEHPSRLLGKKQELDVSSSRPDGVVVESKTASPGMASELET